MHGVRRKQTRGWERTCDLCGRRGRVLFERLGSLWRCRNWAACRRRQQARLGRLGIHFDPFYV